MLAWPAAWGAFIAPAAFIALAFSSTAANAGSQGPLDQAQSSSSASRLKDLNLEELGNIEVTTYSKTPTDLWATPAAVYVISGDDILRSGATSIADVLRLAPGVEVARLSSTTWAVGIRGLQSNFSKSVLVLIDGRSVYTPLFAGVYWDVQDMPLDNIDHIEVIRGPGGNHLGPECGERRNQHHHQDVPRDAGRGGRCAGRQRRPHHRRPAVWRRSEEIQLSNPGPRIRARA